MSRSYRHTPITGLAGCRSEKQDKRLANRRFRSRSRQLVRLEKEPFVKLREISDIWDFGKDGKQYLTKDTILKYPKEMRK